MSGPTQAEQWLVDQVRSGDARGWGQLVERFQGRLLAFARSKVHRPADAEDLVQDTFIAFLKGLESYRGEAGLETWLFTILRRKIIDAYRRNGASHVCLLGDVRRDDGDSDPGDTWRHVAGRGETASWYARRDEHQARQRSALADALTALVTSLRQGGKLRELKTVELLFYCQAGNRETAAAVGIEPGHVGVLKHRWLAEVHSRIPTELRGLAPDDLESLLTETWEQLRLSCPKRSTIGAWLLGTLEADWADYVAFHVESLGCTFCRANRDDLQKQTAAAEQANPLREKIMQSTVGFLR